MIINIAGTSGSGKSHLVRGFITWAEKHGVVKPCYIDDRKEPIGYDVFLKGRHRTVYVVGAYQDADTAGCDTIRDVVWLYDYIRDEHSAGKDIIYEGLFMMNMTRGPKLAAETEAVTVIQLTEPLAVCLASIDARRHARGEGRLLTKDNTVNNFTRATNYCDKMKAAGAAVTRTKRSDALEVLLELLGE